MECIIITKTKPTFREQLIKNKMTKGSINCKNTNNNIIIIIYLTLKALIDNEKYKTKST